MTTGRLLTTPRLMLEPLSKAHAAGLFEILGDAKNIQFWQPTPHQSIDETRAWIIHKLSFIGDTWWTILTRDPREVIGCVDLIGAMVMGMGYLIRADRRRQGHAAEAVSAALDEGFQYLGYNRFELWINAANIPSQRLALKVGFRQRGQFYQRNDGNPYETLVMGMRADEWAAARNGSFRPAGREVAFYGVTPVLHVPALLETVEFYVDQLGFSLDYIDGHPPNFAIVSRGEWTSERAQLHLVQSDPDAIPPPGSLYFRIGAAVEVLYDEFRAKGVAIVNEPFLQPYGIKEFSIRDTNGWLLRFAGVN